MAHHTLSRLIFSLLMSLLMSGFITCWVTWLNLGINFSLAHWANAFIHAWPVAFLFVLFFAPFVQKISNIVLSVVTKIIDKESRC